MTTAFQIFTQPSQQALDTAANVLSGATLAFTLTGTSTPTNAYSDSALTTPVANPLSANAAGVWIPIFLDPTITYRVVLKTAAGAVLQTWDPANESLLTQELIGRLLNPLTLAEISAGVTPTNYAYQELDSRRYGADPTGAADSTTAILNAILVASQNGGVVLLVAGIYKISSTIILRNNVRLIGAGRGDYNIGQLTRITQLRPTAGFSGTDIVRADPADFGSAVYVLGIGASDFTIDMFAVKSAGKVALRLKSASNCEDFENLAVINADSGQAVRIGVSSNGGALPSDGLIFRNLYTLSNGIDVANTDPVVIVEDSNEITFRDGKITRRSNGAPAVGSVAVEVRCTNVGVSAVIFDGTSFAGLETHVKTTATGGGTGARWVRAINTTHEVYKYGFYFDGTVGLPAAYAAIHGGCRFLSPIAGAVNVTLDHATNCTVILDEVAGSGGLVNATANSSANSIWAQNSQVTDAGTNNVIFGRSGGALQVNRIFSDENTFTLTSAAGLTGSPTGTARYTRVGNEVTMYLPQMVAAASGAAISFSGIPVSLRPARQQICACMVADNTLDRPGFFRVNTDGTATLYVALAAGVGTVFTNAGTQGLEASSVHYGLI